MCLSHLLEFEGEPLRLGLLTVELVFGDLPFFTLFSCSSLLRGVLKDPLLVGCLKGVCSFFHSDIDKGLLREALSVAIEARRNRAGTGVFSFSSTTKLLAKTRLWIGVCVLGGASGDFRRGVSISTSVGDDIAGGFMQSVVQGVGV